MGHLTRIANAVVQSLEGGPVQTQVSEVLRGERLQAQVSLPEVPHPCPWPIGGPDQHWCHTLGTPFATGAVLSAAPGPGRQPPLCPGPPAPAQTPALLLRRPALL